MACLIRLAVLVVDAVLVEYLVGVGTTAVGDVSRTALGVDKHFEALVDFGCIFLEVETFGLLLVIDIGIETTAQYHNVAELVDVLQADL